MQINFKASGNLSIPAHIPDIWAKKLSDTIDEEMLNSIADQPEWVCFDCVIKAYQLMNKPEHVNMYKNLLNSVPKDQVTRRCDVCGKNKYCIYFFHIRTDSPKPIFDRPEFRRFQITNKIKRVC